MVDDTKAGSFWKAPEYCGITKAWESETAREEESEQRERVLNKKGKREKKKRKTKIPRKETSRSRSGILTATIKSLSLLDVNYELPSLFLPPFSFFD